MEQNMNLSESVVAASPNILTDVVIRPTVRTYKLVALHSKEGKVEGYYYPVRQPNAAVIYLGSVTGGFDTPGVNTFPIMAEDLQHRHVASLRVRLRAPGNAADSMHDCQLAVAYLRSVGYRRIAAVGYGTGAAWAAALAAQEAQISALALLSPILPDAGVLDLIPERCRKLLIHAGRDTGLSSEMVRGMYARMSDPKEFFTFRHSTRSLVENSVDLHLRLRTWSYAWRQEAQPPGNA
jgi:pimeloyl-ACP methyl ester carboxylesterase